MNCLPTKRGAALVALLVVGPVVADIPVDLRGTWVVDTAATTAIIKKSPEWNQEDKEMLPMMQRMWSRMSFTVTADSLITTTRGKTESVDADLVATKKAGHILKITDERGKETRAAFQLLSKGRLRMLTGKKSDSASPIWKKGQAVKYDPDVDSNILAGVMEQTLGMRSRSLAKEKQPTRTPSKKNDALGPMGKIVMEMYRAVDAQDYPKAAECVTSRINDLIDMSGSNDWWRYFTGIKQHGAIDFEVMTVTEERIEAGSNSGIVVVKQAWKDGATIEKTHHLIREKGSWKVKQ